MDDDKPFTCDLKGCTQKFANSDHLAVHKQKHLSVKIGIKTFDSVVDQTPTPTRFLKNFDEEAGLFADLENPFDQDFKKASADVSPPASSSSVSTPTPTADGKVASTSTVASSAAASSGSADFAALTTLSYISSLSNEVTSSRPSLNPATVVVVNRSNDTPVPAASLPGLGKNIVAIIANPKNPVPKATKMPAISSSSQHKGALGASIMAVPTPAIVSSGSALPNGGSSNNNNGSSQSRAMSIAKQKLKESLQQHAAAATTVPTMALQQAAASQSPAHLSSSPSPTNSVSTFDDDNDAFYGSPHSSQKRSRRSQDEVDPDERRNKFLERNRAAASRCRQKRKIWVQQLEKRAEDLCATNSQLQGEITQLRAEVAQLKALLLAHKDCPITMQQQAIFSQVTNGSYIGVSTEGSRHVALVTNGGSPSTSSAEEVASSALTDMASRAPMEMENRVTTGNAVVMTTSGNTVVSLSSLSNSSE